MVHVIHKLSIEDNERRKPKTKTKQKLIHNVHKHSCKRGLFSQKELKNLQAKKISCENTEHRVWYDISFTVCSAFLIIFGARV